MNRLFLLVISLFIFIQAQLIGLLPTIKSNSETTNQTQSQPVDLVGNKSDETTIEKALPSVVTIRAEEISQESSGNSDDSSMPFPYKPYSHESSTDQPEDKPENVGSGFAAGSNGIIITSKHVISDTNHTYKVIGSDKKEYKIKKIYQHPTTDLAILEVEGMSIEPILLGNSSRLKLGEKVYAIGTPLGEFTNSVTSGIVSGLGRGIMAGSPDEDNSARLENLIQTDTAINPGNSGGPLINASGEVIGINTAGNAESQNINFAIPSNEIKEFITDYKNKNGKS